MNCENKVSYHIPHGLSTREIFLRCGSTDYHGGRAICESCLADPPAMAEINRAERMIDEDNAAARAAGWGEF
jgi:hypothetical protein